MQNFICDRFIVVPIPASELSADFHAGICKQAYDLIGVGSGNPMDAVHAELPELQKVLDSPSVNGALESLLGREYIMHSHRHLHEKFAHDLGFQHFHLDDSVAASHWVTTSHAEPWTLIAFYYPQATSLEMGPTGVLPGSQYTITAPFRTSDEEQYNDVWTAAQRSVTVAAGSVVLCHFDLWHRGCANFSSSDRWNFKYNFFRAQVPVAPSWNHASSDWIAPPPKADEAATEGYSNAATLSRLQPIWVDVWAWMQGRGSAAASRPHDAPSWDPLLGRRWADGYTRIPVHPDAIEWVQNAVAEMTPALQGTVKDVVVENDDAAFRLSARVCVPPVDGADVASKIERAAHRVLATASSARSDNFTVFADSAGLCYAEGRNGWVEFSIPAATATEPGVGLTEVLVRYASGEPRPLSMLIDGAESGALCIGQTSGFGEADVEWRTHTPLNLDRTKPHVIRLETSGYFPHLMELAFVPADEGVDVDGFNEAQSAHGAGANGNVVALCPEGGQWVNGGEAGQCCMLYVRGGRLVFDIGWEGEIASAMRIDDGLDHDVSVEFSAGAYCLHIDGDVAGIGLDVSGMEDQDPAMRSGSRHAHSTRNKRAEVTQNNIRCEVASLSCWPLSACHLEALPLKHRDALTHGLIAAAVDQATSDARLPAWVRRQIPRAIASVACLSPQKTLSALGHLLLHGAHPRTKGAAALSLASATGRVLHDDSFSEEMRSEIEAQATYMLLAAFADEAPLEVAGPDNAYNRRGAGISCAIATALGMMLGNERCAGGAALPVSASDHIFTAIRALHREVLRKDCSHALRFDSCLALARIGTAARNGGLTDIFESAKAMLKSSIEQMDSFTTEISQQMLARWS